MKRTTILAFVMVATAAGWLAGIGTAPYATGKEPRFQQLTMDQLNDKQLETFMICSPNGFCVGLGGPYNPMLRSLVFGQKMFDLLYYLRWQTSMPLKLNEFAVGSGARRWSGSHTRHSRSRLGCRLISSTN